jgi:pyruvate/2-oxoglutarate dehydrogenase complex dihydrolipoamide dehydrogenase (E3) component
MTAARAGWLAARFFLNIGTHAAIPGVPGLDAARPLTHIEALELDYLPPHLIVLGSGYVGLEIAQAANPLESRSGRCRALVRRRSADADRKT